MWEGLQAVRKEIQESVNTIHDNEEIHDGFQLRFVGKSYAKFVTGLPSETVLVPDNDWNNQENNKDSQNIFITGDNLDALKHLVNAYSGAIKMIYIDPPYNTGSDGFVYKDSFKFSDEDLKQKLGFSDTELARLRALDGKCSHSAWLTFMLPRLILAKRLLSDDGVIFISIDNNEQSNLKKICDEVFGENNFVENIIWQKKFSPQNDAIYFSTMHDFILCYAKKKKGAKAEIGWNRNLLIRESMPDGYKNPDNDPRGPWSSGDYTAEGPTPNCVYEIQSPSGKVWMPPQGKRWVYNKENFEKLFAENRFWFGKDNDSFPRIKRYWSEVQQGMVPNSMWFFEDVGHTQEGKQETNDLFGAAVFDYPKPVRLLKQIIHIGSDKNSLILDFFAGSATTAHAVMQLNKDDGGNRKYIMVQWDEPVKAGSEAENQGFKTIDEISRKRIKLAAEQIGDTSGFKHYKLAKVTDDLILDKIDEFDPTKPNLLSDDMVSPFSGNALGTGLNASGLDTLLTTWMVDDGYPINTKVEEFKFGNYVAYSPVGSRRLYLISDGWDSNATQDLLNKIGRNEISVQTIIIYNHSFNFTMLTELKNNLKHVLDDDKKIEIIERF